MFFRRLALYQKMQILALDLSIQKKLLGRRKSWIRRVSVLEQKSAPCN
jgi:hypothetical protein